MKKCLKCNVTVDTDRKTCPLCFHALEQIGESTIVNTPFPKPQFFPKRINIFIRVLAFITILGIITSITINYLTYNEIPRLWSLIVILGSGYFWILTRLTFRGKGNIPMRLVVQMLALSTLTFVIDLVSNFSGWSINYVIPFLSMASLLAINTILVGNSVRYSDYVMFLIAAIIFGFIPFVLWLFNIATELWPSLSAASLSFVTFIAMLVFADKETKEEIKKRFHI